MESGIDKTIVFLSFILIGVLLKTKFKSREELNGIKKIILNLALPATIFIALLGIEIQWNLALLPFLALGLNLFLFWAVPLVLPVMGIRAKTAEYRTARLLIPSLAPGLSCFPFVLEFLGETYLAKAAMADLGNKVFVLIFLYLVAMSWHYGHKKNARKEKGNLTSLIKALISEPVNIFIVVAVLFLGFGFTMDSLPFFVGDILEKLSLIMTPLVLLFIGLGLKIKRRQFFQIFSILCIRAGLVFLLCGIFSPLLGLNSAGTILLMLAFGLSACSFWPYAHISGVDLLEKNSGDKKTFDSGFALNILALSFPFSTLLILGVLNTGTFFVPFINLLLAGSVLIIFGLAYPAIIGIQKKQVSPKLTKPKLKQTAAEHV